jgi:ubiquinone/menaquinone biosynthesis C-methylase UbiE
MSTDRRLLKRCLNLWPAQPATALFRSIEIARIVDDQALPSAGRGLDLGCGDGVVARILQDELDGHWELVGLDPDEAELRLARASGVYSETKRSVGSRIDVPDQSFDFVLSNSVLEHIDDIEATLREVSRVLRPRGVFVFTAPSTKFHEHLGTPGLLGRLATGESAPDGYHRALDKRLGHLRYFDREKWARALADVGLEVVRDSSYLTPRQTRRWAAASNATSGLLLRLKGCDDRPIDIQRQFGLKEHRSPVWIRIVGPAIGRIFAIGLDPQRDQTVGSCLLVIARKPVSLTTENIPILTPG